MPDRDTATLDSGRAWLDMTLAALSMFTVFATAYSFGTFVKPMAAEFGADRSSLALVFGLTAFLYFTLGAITGPLVHRVGPRALVVFGGTIQVAGIWLTSRVTSLTQAYATYGIAVGIGVACCYVPMVAVVGGWFERRRATAVGLAVSGIGLSSLIGAPVAARLIRAYGWRDAYVVFAIATAVLLAIVAIFVRTPPNFRRSSTLQLSSALRSRRFALSYVSVLLCSVPLFSVFVHLVPYAEDHSISKVTAATLLSCLGASSIVGRIGLAALADRLGTPIVYFASFGVMAFSQIIWLLSGSHFGVLVAFALLFGTAYGGFISLSPSFLAGLFGAANMGSLTGINYSAAGFGALVGPTFGAWLLDRTGDYHATILTGLGAGILGWVILGVLVRSILRPSPHSGTAVE